MRMFARAVGVLNMLLPLVALLGWLVDFESMCSVVPGMTPMNPVTAICFLLSGTSLVLLTHGKWENQRRWSAVPLVIIGGARLVQNMLGVRIAMDTLVFHGKLHGNTMAINTAINFVLLGLSLCLRDGRRSRQLVMRVLTIAAAVISMLAITGYAFNMGLFYTVPHATIPMALNTAVCFLLLAVGVLCARPDQEPMATVMSDTGGAVLARRLLPAAVLIPFLLGLLSFAGHQRKYFDANFAISLTVVFDIVIFSSLVWATARWLHAAELRRREAENSARQLEKRYHAVIEQAAEGIYLTDVKTRTILEANHAFSRLLGYLPSEAKGADIHQLVADSAENIDAQIQKIIAAGAPVLSERQYRHRDGSVVDMQVSSTVIDDAQGKVLCTVVRDITERKRAEAALRSSELRSRLIVDTANDAFVAMDVEGNIIEWNRQAEVTFGWRRSDAIGRPLVDTIIPPQYREAHTRGLAKYFETGEGPVLNNRIEITAIRHDGEEFPIEMTIAPIEIDKRLFFSAFVHDITTRNRVRAQLQEHNKLLAEAADSERKAHAALKDAQTALVQTEKLAGLGQMVAGVAHEINNPLAFVSNNVAVLQRDLSGIRELLALYAKVNGSLLALQPDLATQIAELTERLDLTYSLDNLTDLLARSRDGLRRIQQIVKDLRDFARLDEGDFHEVDLNAGLESTVNIILGRAKKHQVRIETDLAPLPPVSCYPAKINQVVMNLLANAIDASPEGGVVKLRTWRQGEEVAVEVSDTGPGVPEAIREKIFDPFFTTKPQGSGTGLGLSISYGIVQEHGGRIELGTTAEGGAQVTVHIPFRRFKK